MTQDLSEITVTGDDGKTIRVLHKLPSRKARFTAIRPLGRRMARDVTWDGKPILYDDLSLTEELQVVAALKTKL